MLQVPPPHSTAGHAASSGRQWPPLAPTPGARRSNKAGPGLSLKQQASSPRWGARSHIGPSLTSPGAAPAPFRMGNAALPLPRRQARFSQLGLPVRSRRALSEDQAEAEVTPGEVWRLSRAQSVTGNEAEIHVPFIEMRNMEAAGHQDEALSPSGRATALPRIPSGESLPPWTAPTSETHAASQEAQSRDDEYGDWADSNTQEQSEDPKQKLLP